MSAKVTKSRNMTSSLSKREKILRKPFSRRNRRSISLRRLYNALSHGQGRTVRRSSQPAQQPAPLRGVVCVAGREHAGNGCPGIRGNHVKSGVPATPGPAEGLRTVSFSAPYRRDVP